MFFLSYDLQVFDAVIEPVVVDVVDLLPSLQPAPNVLLHHPPMLQVGHAVALDSPIL
jgi:hypothetical protein